MSIFHAPSSGKAIPTGNGGSSEPSSPASARALQPDALWALSGPHRLACSRAAMAPNGSVRLPVNVPVSTHIGTGRFVSELACVGRVRLTFAGGDAAGVLDAAAANQAPRPVRRPFLGQALR